MGIKGPQDNLFGQPISKDNRALFSVGVNYTLPMLVVFQTGVLTNGYVRMQLMREDIPILKRLRFSFMLNTDREYMGGLKDIVTKNIALSTPYDSDMGWAARVTISFQYIGFLKILKHLEAQTKQYIMQKNLQLISKLLKRTKAFTD